MFDAAATRRRLLLARIATGEFSLPEDEIVARMAGTLLDPRLWPASQGEGEPEATDEGPRTHDATATSQTSRREDAVQCEATQQSPGEPEAGEEGPGMSRGTKRRIPGRGRGTRARLAGDGTWVERHEEEDPRQEECLHWAQGACERDACGYRHSLAPEPEPAGPAQRGPGGPTDAKPEVEAADAKPE